MPHCHRCSEKKLKAAKWAAMNSNWGSASCTRRLGTLAEAFGVARIGIGPCSLQLLEVPDFWILLVARYRRLLLHPIILNSALLLAQVQR